MSKVVKIKVDGKWLVVKPDVDEDWLLQESDLYSYAILFSFIDGTAKPVNVEDIEDYETIDDVHPSSES